MDNHGTVTYIIVPFASVTKEMVENAAETSMDTLRHTVSGEDKVILKYIKYKTTKNNIKPVIGVVDYNTSTITVDGKEVTKIDYSADVLDYNKQFSVYDHAHETVPAVFLKYNEYTYEQILIELQKPEWVNTKEDIL